MESSFNVGKYEIKLNYKEDGKNISVDIDDKYHFNDLREFTYFINKLTDIDEDLLKKEEALNG
jgi:hypothetical protein